MHTEFTDAQRQDPYIQEADKILRKCVHCGFCTATCPTYRLLGHESDSPRGRVYLVKRLLENPGAPSETLVGHLDRCLSCLSCMTTCPSGVDYRHLMDHARAEVDRRFDRGVSERLFRNLLVDHLSEPKRFRRMLKLAGWARPFKAMLPGVMGEMVAKAPARLPMPATTDQPGVFKAEGEQIGRLALLPGCVQPVLRPDINAAAIRLLTRHGFEVVVPEGLGCCGALAHHMGKEPESKARVRQNIDALERCEREVGPIDHWVMTASGCGSMAKDYHHVLKDDESWRDRARSWSERARDLVEILDPLYLRVTPLDSAPAVAVHNPCSLQHGQKITGLPGELLVRCGFSIQTPKNAHLCCGSAGTYSLLQPDLSKQLRDDKVSALTATGATLVASGNIGCLEHLAGNEAFDVVHWVELMDWATGGPQPDL
ncbi:glycolate oxidase subunit GlcF [Magnetospira sp. QH-2]|uniref:glycolate oxidase subunit GlcF n=1 Tax=Magnetospira sp. (strain QH-2) TaxID=1288970 RepID=UPI0003E80BAE|nr:glycolate oxidase subunit GlcF [Magnetospira sp. QH-2]CCQ72518.1 Glycolate oxidase subunit, (Fe-S)protein, GlcF [Magnetospira sp. QH-2]